MAKRAGRLARGRPRSQGSGQKPGAGQFFVVLSKTSWGRDQLTVERLAIGMDGKG